MGKSADRTSFDTRLDETLNLGLPTTEPYEAGLATIKRAAASIER